MVWDYILDMQRKLGRKLGTGLEVIRTYEGARHLVRNFWVGKAVIKVDS